MNKTLIAILIAGAGYVAYDSMQSENKTPSQDTITEVNIKEDKAMYEEHQLTDDEKSEIFGTYAVKIEDENMTATQVYTLNSDGTFDHSRTMSRPKKINAATSGNYELNGNLLTLHFGEDRDKSNFPLETIEMAITKSGTILSGKNELIKQ